MATLNIGDEVPDFELPAVVGNIKQQFKLSDYRGKKNVVLATSIRPTGLRFAPRVAALSADVRNLPATMRRWWHQRMISPQPHGLADQRDWDLNFPLASDFYSHGAVASGFGIQREGDPLPGVNERAIFVVDKRGKLAFGKVYPSGRYRVTTRSLRC